MKSNEIKVDTRCHYSKEFKNRFITEWNNEYRYYFRDVIPNRSTVKNTFLSSMADIMLQEFPEEAMKHNGDDKNRLIQNLYHCYVRWIERSIKQSFDRYKVIVDSEVKQEVPVSVLTEAEIKELRTISENITSDEDTISMKSEDLVEDTNVDTDNSDNMVDVKSNECIECTEKTNKYNVTLQYAKPKFGVVLKWITAVFDINATDEINAIAKAYEYLWRRTGDITHTRIREKSVLVAMR